MKRMCALLGVLVGAHCSGDIVPLVAPAGESWDSVAISRNGAWIGASTRGPSGPSVHRIDAATLADQSFSSAATTSYQLGRNCISDDGNTIAFRGVFGTSLFSNNAYRWRSGATTQIKSGYSMQDRLLLTTHMSANGNRVFGTGPDVFGQYEAWVSSNGALGTEVTTGPVGGPRPTAPSCTADGATALWCESFGQGSNASYRWTTGGVQTIDNGVKWYVLSSDGSLWGGIDNARRLYTWAYPGGAPTQVGSFQTGQFGTLDYVRGDGSLLMGQTGSFNAVWVWTTETGIVDLRVFAQTMGVDMTGWSSLTTADVSDDGRTFAGFGTYQGHQGTPYLLTIPTPASVWSLGLLAAWGAHRRRGPSTA